jgi:hypothetical protein
MFKPNVIATALLCVLTIYANARSHHRQHYAHRAHGWCGNYMSRYFGKSDRRLAQLLVRQCIIIKLILRWARLTASSASISFGS